MLDRLILAEQQKSLKLIENTQKCDTLALTDKKSRTERTIVTDGCRANQDCRPNGIW